MCSRSPQNLKFSHFTLLGSFSNNDCNANENESSRYVYYFAIIPIRSTCRMWVKYPGTKLIGTTFRYRRIMKNSPSCAHVLRKTLNLVISRRCFGDDGKEMYQNKKCTCRAIILLIKPIVLWRSRCRCLMFCRGRRRNVPKFITHVQRIVLLTKSYCLMTFPLPSSSYLLKKSRLRESSYGNLAFVHGITLTACLSKTVFG